MKAPWASNPSWPQMLHDGLVLNASVFLPTQRVVDGSQLQACWHRLRADLQRYQSARAPLDGFRPNKAKKHFAYVQGTAHECDLICILL